MVRVREARRAFRRFRSICFRSSSPDLAIGAADVPWVAAQLILHGNEEARAMGSRLSATTSRSKLPGEDLVVAGLHDLSHGIASANAFLVSIAAPRLTALGLDLPKRLPDPELGLYRVLAARHGDAAHARYNALIRRMVSYQRALACAR